jgi:formylmethanofuran dehydrogenase subunit E
MEMEVISPSCRIVHDPKGRGTFSEYLCLGCGKWMSHDDTVWQENKPFCMECLPNGDD